MQSLLSVLFLAASVASTPVHPSGYGSPSVDLRNGTYTGNYLAEYGQDEFAGIPFAQPPVGDLRFGNPEPLTETWSGSREAQRLSASCVGYGDCLYLNVWRPSGRPEKKLPVAVWIHGGGFVQGAGSDLRYNLSHMVDQSQTIGHPIIAVNLNYRLSAWGFLNSKDLFASGSSNMGLRDQHLALRWIKENIAAFGGDPDNITIWGQSAGGMSVGAQMLAFNGRDDGLYHRAIMASGNFLSLSSQAELAERPWELLLANTGCDAASDAVKCLRALPFDKLNAVINTTELSGSWRPRIDGDFVARETYHQLLDGDFVRVPIIIGDNTDEGTSFGPKGINTVEQFAQSMAQRSPGLSEEYLDQLTEAYTGESVEPVLTNMPEDWTPPASAGSLYKSVTAYFGDTTFIAARRLIAQTWAREKLPVWTYRFNAVPAWATYLDGATHFVEVAFAMRNLDGVGYPPVRVNPFEGLSESYRDLARLMSSDWVHFIATGNPNGWEGREEAARTLGVPVPAWPKYRTGSKCGQERNFVYEGNVTTRVEEDTYRARGIELILEGSLDALDGQ